MFLSTYHPNAILAQFGPVTIHWYGLFLAIGALAGFLLLVRLAKPYRLEISFLYDLFVAVVIGGFVGGRLYHVSNELAYYRSYPQEIWQVWNGGLAIHGALVVGAIVTWWMAKRKKISAWLLLDLLAPALALGQAIGRWGNYFNQELFGRPTSVPWKIVIDPPYRSPATFDQEFFHPAFLYESLGSLIVCIILVWLLRSRQTIHSRAKLWIPTGTIFATYLIFSSVVRFGVETIRIDRVPILFDIRLPLLTAGLLVLVGFVVFIFRYRRYVR